MMGLGLRAYARHRAAKGLTGTTHHAVQEAIKSGRLSSSLTADKKKIADPYAADAEWLSNTQADRVPLDGPTAPAATASGAVTPRTSGPPDLQESRARRAAAQADLAELELAARRGRLVDVTELTGEFNAHITNAKARLLALPTRVGQELPDLAERVVPVVDRLIRAALQELAADGSGS